jgi:tRNA threonylcarbamoyladenosine biosynthesis protein TsaE
VSAAGPTRTLVSDSPARTQEIGAELAEILAPGDVVLVSGELGTGKTTLIRGACRALGVEGPVRSPTFTIGTRHRGRVAISHLDLYRLDDLENEAPGLLDDYFVPDAVVFVEWPERARWDGRAALRVAIKHWGGDRRRVAITGHPHLRGRQGGPRRPSPSR